MKNLYNISKGQLITLWSFGFLGWLWAWSEATYGSGGIFILAIPFALIFYTIGWRNHKKSNQ